MDYLTTEQRIKFLDNKIEALAFTMDIQMIYLETITPNIRPVRFSKLREAYKRMVILKDHIASIVPPVNISIEVDFTNFMNRINEIQQALEDLWQKGLF